jgi:cytidine deaminase
MIPREVLDRLFVKAVEAARTAYAPYSGTMVGAALLTSDGRIFTGANVENASYGLSVCAERSAGISAVVAGARSWEAIAIAFVKGRAGPPCGACCQFLAEFASDDLTVMWGGEGGPCETALLGLLFPKAYKCNDHSC